MRLLTRHVGPLPDSQIKIGHGYFQNRPLRECPLWVVIRRHGQAPDPRPLLPRRRTFGGGLISLTTVRFTRVGRVGGKPPRSLDARAAGDHLRADLASAPCATRAADDGLILAGLTLAGLTVGRNVLHGLVTGAEFAQVLPDIRIVCAAAARERASRAQSAI
jgi:hypothetical protein